MTFLEKIAAQIPFLKKPNQAKYFFALNISLNTVVGSVWEALADRVDIVGQKSLTYTDSEDLLVQGSNALDQALGAFEIEPNQILFGVPDAWILDEDLKEPYLKLLRRMVKEYELEPLAYISNSHAIAHLLQKQEGVPPTVILIEIDQALTVTVIKSGQIIGSRAEMPGEEEIYEAIERALLHFSDVEALPSRMLVFSQVENDEKLSRIRDGLTSHHWMSKLPFLHLPKIEVLAGPVLVQAVILSGAAEVSPNLSLKHSFTSTPISYTPTLPATKSLADAGFVVGNIGKITPTEITGKLAAFEEDVKEMVGSSRLSILGSFLKEKLAFLKELIPRQLGLRSNNHLILLTLGIALLILAYLLLTKAVVTIFVEPKILTKDAQIVVDPKISTVDNVKNIIPGEITETSVTSSGKLPVTGKKQIGDPARGQVIIYNKTAQSKSFSQGTTLAGPNNLKFTLDTSVSVASQSSIVGADFTTVITPGRSNAIGITAVTVGPESNLSSGTNLSLEGISQESVVARVDSALTGGTSKEVAVVSADDQKKLQEAVLLDAKNKAKDEIQSKLTDSKKIITEALTVIDSTNSFNKRINDQATELSLSSTIKLRGTIYKDADVKALVSKLVETNVQDGYELNLSETETQADVAKVEKDGKIIFLARFKAKLFPKFDLEQLKKTIRGRSVSQAAADLRTHETILESEIRLTPSLPAFLARVPLLTRNINIMVTPK